MTYVKKKSFKTTGSFKTSWKILNQGKLTIYNSFIVLNFNYCPLAWHFCSMSSKNKMEKVQERALRFVNNDFASSLQDLLSATSTVPLHVKRMKQMATEVSKIVNDMSPEYIKDLITIQNSSYNFRRENQASLPQVKSTRYGLRSFHYEAARIWNCLTNELRKAESFPQFRRLLHASSWDGIICKCSSCSV